MKIKIACVGKVKDSFYRDAVAEYAKRLSRFCVLEIAEVADEKAPETLSLAEEAQVMEREGEEYCLRPMNCPHHIMVFESELHSYRELPIRIAELGNTAGLLGVASLAFEGLAASTHARGAWQAAKS